jgi:chemotaxis protein CheZ
MNTMTRPDDSGDSEDLQALFDNIAGATPPVKPPPPEPDPAGDSADLQDLFDSVAAEAAPAVEQALNDISSAAGDSQEAMFNNLGKMARKLHDSLRELGYDKALEDAATQIPDARQRLMYIAQMTEQAASKVLNATDIAKPIADQLGERATDLSARWEKMFANQLSVEDFKALAADSRAYFAEAPGKLQINSQQLTEIMMAQDFQDLTGQVIKKVVDIAHSFESSLLKLLVEVMPESRKVEAPEGLLNGPVINTAGRNDIVTDQAQVDDLLESLGF